MGDKAHRAANELRAAALTVRRRASRKISRAVALEEEAAYKAHKAADELRAKALIVRHRASRKLAKLRRAVQQRRHLGVAPAPPAAEEALALIYRRLGVPERAAFKATCVAWRDVALLCDAAAGNAPGSAVCALENLYLGYGGGYVSADDVEDENDHDDEDGELPDIACLQLEHWESGPAERYWVRGPRYLKDRKKVPSASAPLELVAVDLLRFADTLPADVAAHPQSWLQRERIALGSQVAQPWTLVINFMNPSAGPPNGDRVCIVQYFRPIGATTLEDFLKLHAGTSLGQTLSRWIAEGPEAAVPRLKVIVAFLNAPLLVRMGVPANKPLKFASNLPTAAVVRPGYLHISVDYNVKSVERIYKSIFRFCPHVQVELAYIIEALHDDELPEVVLGVCRLLNISYELATPLEPAEYAVQPTAAPQPPRPGRKAQSLTKESQPVQKAAKAPVARGRVVAPAAARGVESDKSRLQGGNSTAKAFILGIAVGVLSLLLIHCFTSFLSTRPFELPA